MRNKLFLTIIIAFILCLLCSCEAAPSTPNDTTPSFETTTDTQPPEQGPSEVELKLDGRNLNFGIVYHDEIDTMDAELASAHLIRGKLKELFGANPKLGTDFVPRGDTHDSETIEILVGRTNYAETDIVINSNGSYGDYFVKLVGNKIVLFSYDEAGYTSATNALINFITEQFNEDTKSASIKSDELDIVVNYNAQLAKLPKFEGGRYFAYYDAGMRTTGERCDEIIIEETTPELFDAYLSKLESAGFTKYTSNEANKNKFATYNNKFFTINVGYYEYDKTTRILIEPLAPAAGLKEDNKYQKITDSQITMIGLEFLQSDGLYNGGGLSTVIRLEDGRFVIVDGGLDRVNSANALVSVLKEQSKEYTTTPTVAAWIVTHCHSDHYGVIVGKTAFVKSNGIKVERILSNFTSEAELNKAINAQDSIWSEYEGYGYKSVITAAESFGAELYKMHVGQKYYYADLEMEVLFTLESYAPTTLNVYNASSPIIKMTFGGKTTYLCTGDATGDGMEIAAKMFGDYMQCDIVQVCHHGATTYNSDSGMMAGYRTTAPSLVLIPNGIINIRYGSLLNKGYNSVLFTLPSYKECYISGAIGDLTIIKLPYVAGSSVSGPNPYIP